MNLLNVFRATTATPGIWVSSAAHPSAVIAGLGAETTEVVTTALNGSAGIPGLHRVSRARFQQIGTRQMLWFRVQPALSVGGITATQLPLSQSVAGSDSDGATHAPPAPRLPAAASGQSPPPAAHASAAPAHSPSDLLHSSVASLAPVPPMPPAKPASAISRIELTIDSLRAYDLIRPIPVVVEVLGERNYVAELPDLNISISASNQSDIIIILKDRIAQIYDTLRLLKHLDTEQSRQLKILESYIVKTRRGWLDRR
jgi:hypothetical protein